MTIPGKVAGRVATWPGWTRTGLLAVGAGLVFVAVYVTNDGLTHLSRMDGHAAAHSAAGAVVAIALVAAPTFLLGVRLAAVGVTVPGDTRWPSIPDLGFTPSSRQRRRIVQGALLQGVGPIVGALAGIMFGRLPVVDVPTLAVPPVLLGWGLIIVGIASRFVPDDVSTAVSGTARPTASTSTFLANVRTALVAGSLGVAVGIAHFVRGTNPGPGTVWSVLSMTVGSAAAGFGTSSPVAAVGTRFRRWGTRGDRRDS